MEYGTFPTEREVKAALAEYEWLSSPSPPGPDPAQD